MQHSSCAMHHPLTATRPAASIPKSPYPSPPSKARPARAPAATKTEASNFEAPAFKLPELRPFNPFATGPAKAPASRGRTGGGEQDANTVN
jgi:hypothetical protein